jgi:multiple sugar transport system ATP-binding protein
MADVVIDRVTKRFGGVAAVDDVSLTIPDGEFIVLLGPTGAGKTTLLRLVAGLERPEAGTVTIDGRDVTRELPAERDVSFVYQQYSLYPHLTVAQNLAFPLRAPLRRMSESAIAQRVNDVARLVRIEHKLNSSATRLSGGEMQRVAIGRALVRSPAIYLMDEPLSSLDAKLRAELRIELKHIQTDLGATILYVTHDQTEAMTMANRIGIDRGKLVQVGTPREIYETPVNSYVAARLGTPSINFLPVRTLGAHGPIPAAVAVVGARTEHLRIAPAVDGPAHLVMVEHLGNESHLHLEWNGEKVVTLAPPEARWIAGDRATIELTGVLYFDAAGARIDD